MPMKIALTTVGSTGDTQPYIALAETLVAAGHQVRVVSHPFHEARFRARGIDYAACGPIVTQQRLNEMLDRMLATRNPVKQLRLLMEGAFFEEGEKYFRQAKAATAGFDLAVSHMADFLGQEAVSQNGIPRIGVILAPAAIPTKYAPPVLAPNLGAPLNRIWWQIMTWLLAGTSNRAMRFLRSLGGTEQRIVRFSAHGPELNLIAASPHLCPTFSDLPPEFKVVGHWRLPEPDYEPDPALAAFLAKHPRPVIVSLGSMGGTKGEALTARLLRSLEISGQPAIIQSGYAGLFAEKVPAQVHFAGYVPHDWLFARGSCVVHHGGAGTSHAACRAGIPSIVIAFIADQPYFAENMQRIGVAPKFIWHHRFTPERLARRIQQVVRDAEMQSRAHQLGEKLRVENGRENALRVIEEYGAHTRDNPKRMAGV